VTQPRTTYRAHLTLIEVVIALLLLGAAGFFLVRNMIQAKERIQKQQLSDALLNQDIAVVKKLLAQHPSWLHVKGEFNQWTPLHLAAHCNDVEFVRWLLDHGAVVDALDDTRQTPLHFACLGGSMEAAELLLSSGANIEAQDDVGWTPLHCAANNQSKTVVELLLKKGANPNAKTNSGETPEDLGRKFLPSSLGHPPPPILRLPDAKKE
jgi:ankyrin repeat protein